MTKVIPINDSMISGYDQSGKKIIRTTNGSEYLGSNTHAEVTTDMKRIVRIFKEGPKEEVKPKRKTRKKKETE